LTQERTEEKSEDMGVPEALPRTLAHLASRLGVESVDRLWIFPGRKRGRREQGLVAVSRYLEGEERRRLFTVAYTAERTGKGLVVEHQIHEEGDSPPALFARVMEGVARRAGQANADPREVEIDGEEARFEELMSEFDPSLLVPERP